MTVERNAKDEGEGKMFVKIFEGFLGI